MYVMARLSEMREDPRKIVTENAAMPINQLFILSQGESLSEKYGPLSFLSFFFATLVTKRWHASTNFFHILERWEIEYI